MMTDRDDPPVYYVNDFEDDQSDAHSISTTTSGFTNNSMSTLTSNEASEYFQEIHGRTFPLAQNAPLVFPADHVEVQRLDLQHAAIKGLLNGNCYGPVKDLLSETSERRKRVLDLPTAEGNWVREMAAEFPRVDFISIDSIPLVPHVQSPNILSYEVYDLYNGIAEGDESFDLVHLRHIVNKFWDLPAFVLEIYRVLRPGGLLIWTEFEPTPRDASATGHSAAENSPNLVRATQLVENTCTRQGAPVYAWRDAPLLLDPKNEIWLNETGTGSRARGFTSVRTEAKMLPVAPWHPSPRLRDVGMLMQQSSREMWTNFIPLFINEGLHESEAEELARKTYMETAELGAKQLYVNYHVLYAFRPV
ncbi:hypothetical protein BDV93DRAFT_605622 [Ceratobasidium sp. AG-I]|nr:hypothetical protein BDV93DRAFT_605622 [Ceratobasidium sp. AG-I]